MTHISRSTLHDSGHYLAIDIMCCSQAMLRALLDANLMVRKAESAERPQRIVSNILPIVLPSREQHRCANIRSTRCHC